MDRPLIINEVSLVVVATNHNPTILNPDFLRYNNIVPLDWELGQPPICVEPMAQVSFKNGVKITAQFEKVIFAESVKNKKFEKLEIASVAYKYIHTLPHVDYRSVGINPTGHVVFDDPHTVQQYLVEKFFLPGPWLEIGNAPVKASIKFVYSLDGSLCNLTIDAARLQVSDGNAIPILLIGANFHHEIIGDSKKERLSDLSLIIENWRTDLAIFKDIANKILI